MNVIISPLSQVPIYEQIYKQIKEQILNGSLESGHQLPSIRVMAKDLTVAVVTIKRAYLELENEKLIITLPGKGCFVNKLDLDKTKEINLLELRKRLKETKSFATEVNISKKEFMKIVEDVYEE